MTFVSHPVGYTLPSRSLLSLCAVGLSRLLLVVVALLSWGLSSHAVAQEIRAGRDYDVLAKPLPTTGSKVQVIEFFSYGCPHCFHFEPELKKWVGANGNKVDFSRSPVIFPGTRWGEAYFAEIYYTLEALGALEASHEAVFEAVQNKGINLSDINALNAWLATQKINPAKFAEARKSFGVQAQMKQAKQRMDEAGVDSTPMLIVAGKYRVLPVGTFSRILEVADVLIYRESQPLKKK